MAALYNRILLKLSGESLAGANQSGINPRILQQYATEIKTTVQFGVQVGIVIGGGNIFRGLSANASQLDRVSADQMGMLATVINSIALADALRRVGLATHVMTTLQMDDFAEYFTKSKALNCFSKGEVVIFGAGTGNPYFTTDTAAVLKAVEVDADIILKGTRVDGVFDTDPEKNASAKMFTNLSYMDVVSKGLKVMDSTAITLAMDNRLPILVFNFNVQGNLQKVVNGENIGTIVGGD